MVKKRKRRTNKRTARGASFPWVTIIFVSLFAIQTLWIAAFITSTHTIIPANVKRWVSGEPDKAWDPVLEQKLDRSIEEVDNLRLQKMLAEEGSKGPGGTGDAPVEIPETE
jgi:hypothetical protein